MNEVTSSKRIFYTGILSDIKKCDIVRTFGLDVVSLNSPAMKLFQEFFSLLMYRPEDLNYDFPALVSVFWGWLDYQWIRVCFMKKWLAGSTNRHQFPPFSICRSFIVTVSKLAGGLRLDISCAGRAAPDDILGWEPFWVRKGGWGSDEQGILAAVCRSLPSLSRHETNVDRLGQFEAARLWFCLYG